MPGGLELPLGSGLRPLVTQTALIVFDLVQAALQLQAPYQLGLVPLKRQVEGDLVPLQLADRHICVKAWR